MLINSKLREINLKVVYYGPPFSGKTTNLMQIYSHVNANQRSKMVSLDTDGGRTLYFDFLQLELGQMHGLTPKIHLYTVPGQANYEISRRLVLQGADGVVFVANLDAGSLAANIRAWRHMHEHLASGEIAPARVPIVVQFNKMDLPQAFSAEKMADLLNINGLPRIPAAAIHGIGVENTLKTILQKVMQGIGVYSDLTMEASIPVQ